MRETAFGPQGACIRWTETPGVGPVRVYLHGLGAASGAVYTHVVAHPDLCGRRSLFVDMLGFGISVRPADFGYSLEDHADAVASVLDASAVREAELIGHSMGGAVAIVLAHRRPDLVGRLILAEANLDPNPPMTAGSSSIAAYSESAFVNGGGFAEMLERIPPVWRATMQTADPLAVHRSAVGLVKGTEPTMRAMLLGLDIPRLFQVGELSGDVDGRAELEAAGAVVETVPNAGHNIMFDNPQALVQAITSSAAAAGA